MSKKLDEDTPIMESEKKLMKIFRERDTLKRLENINDYTLLRFIRGYSHMEKPDEKAQEMLEKFMDWRDKMNVDVIVRSKIPWTQDVLDAWPSGLHGFGKLGHPVYIERVGMIDVLSLLSRGLDITKIMPVHIQVMESLVALTDKMTAERGKLLYKRIVILDLKGFGMKHITKPFYGPLKGLIDVDQYFYPETLYRLIVVNAPFLVQALWAIMKPWLDPITQSKIVWGNDKLEKYIDKTDIPRFLNGTCKCKDGKCLRTTFFSGKETDEKVSSILNEIQLQRTQSNSQANNSNSSLNPTSNSESKTPSTPKTTSNSGNILSSTGNPPSPLVKPQESQRSGSDLSPKLSSLPSSGGSTTTS